MTGYTITAKSRTNLARIFTMLFVLITLGYPLVGLYGSYVRLEENTAAVWLRAGTLGASLLAFGYMLSVIPPSQWRWPGIVFALYVAFAILRLYIDGNSGQWPDATATLGRYVGIVVVPALALCLIAPERDEFRLVLWLSIAGSIFCAMMTLGLVLNLDVFTEATEAASGRLSLDRLNPISTGMAAAMTLIGLFVLYTYRHRLPAWALPLMAVGGVSSGAAFILSGSRGPFVSLGVVILALLVVRKKFVWMAICAAAFLIVAYHTTRNDLEVLDRLASIGSDTGSLERLSVQANAIAQFLAHPFFGNAYLDELTGLYPHNPIVQSAMAMGVIGLGLLLAIYAKAFNGAWTRLAREELFLPLLLVLEVVESQFSGSIYEGAEVWALLGLMLVRARGAGFYPSRLRTSSATLTPTPKAP